MRTYVIDISDVVGWAIVAAAAGLGLYACILFNGIAPALAHGVVSLFF